MARIHPGQTQSRFQGSVEARIQGQYLTCRSWTRSWTTPETGPDSPDPRDFAFALRVHLRVPLTVTVRRNDPETIGGGRRYPKTQSWSDRCRDRHTSLTGGLSVNPSGINNALHWVLDMAFRGTKALYSHRPAVHNMPLLHRQALNLRTARDHGQRRHRHQARAGRLEQRVPTQIPGEVECECPANSPTPRPFAFTLRVQ